MIRQVFLKMLLVLTCVNAFSQNGEIYGGLNSNVFHDFKNNEGHFMSSYKSGLGFCVGIRVDSVKVDWMKMGFSIQYDNIEGDILVSDGGLGGSRTVNAKIEKSIISLGVFPLNFKLLRKFDINFGIELSRLLDETLVGTISGWQLGKPSWNYDLNDMYSRYSSLYVVGLKGRVAYELELLKGVYITPQYSFYYGLGSEFNEFPEETKSMRHYFCLGVKKKIK